jgi:hypothetical protein
MIEEGLDLLDPDLEEEEWDTDKGTAVGDREVGEGVLIVIWIMGLAV